jgi:ABC-2 type transport system permease protein
LRFNALPLYFSRPLRRIDYFLGKLGVIGAFIGMVMVVPAVIAYLLGLLFSLDISIVRDTFSILLASVVYGVVVAFSAGLLILALSSLTRNSRYISLLWLAIWFITLTVSSILQSIEHQQRMRRVWAQGGFNSVAVMKKFADDEIKAGKTDWRPVVSYTSNLSRIGRLLLGTDAAWDAVANDLPPEMRAQFITLHSEPTYPWTWSAGVLVVLFGISVCILNFRIKSLDRLK